MIASSKLEDTKATCIVPVELNSFLHKNAVLASVLFLLLELRMKSMNQSQLAKYHTALGFDEDGMKYEAIADDICRAVNQVQQKFRSTI